VCFRLLYSTPHPTAPHPTPRTPRYQTVVPLDVCKTWLQTRPGATRAYNQKQTTRCVSGCVTLPPLGIRRWCYRCEVRGVVLRVVVCGVVLVVCCVVLFLSCVCVCDLFLFLQTVVPLDVCKTRLQTRPGAYKGL